MTFAPADARTSPAYRFDMMPEEIEAEMVPIRRRMEYEERMAANAAAEPVPTEIERIIMGHVTPAKVASLERKMEARIGLGERVKAHVQQNADLYIGMTLAAAVGGMALYSYMHR